MKGIELQEQNSAVILWNNKEGDLFECRTLINHWDYIWYGTSDEMCLLYFSDVQFGVLITDYDAIYF